MSNRVFQPKVAAVLALVCASCGTGEGLYPVHGKVTYKGEPAAGAYVVLVKDRPRDAGEDLHPAATVEEDGSFTLNCGDRGNGAPPGTYKVMITWMTGLASDAAKAKRDAVLKKNPKARGFKPDQHAMLAPDRLLGRYANPAKPMLTAEVKPETNNLPTFDLTD
jgi:hypothetical protein